MIGQISSTIITALAMILIARFLGATNYGQFTIAMIPINIAGIFLDLGVNSALIKYIAQYRSEGRTNEAVIFLKAGLTIDVLVGFFLTILVFLLSGFLATQVFHQPEIRVLIQVSSLNLVAMSLLNTAKSIFIGYERMKLVSLLVIIQSIVKSIFAPLLVFFGFGAIGAAAGHTTSILVAGLVGIGIILFTYVKQKKEVEKTTYIMEASKTLLSYGVPLFLSILLNGVILQIYNFLMALNVTPSDVGNYQAATNFPMIIAFFTIPISTVLFPLFSKIPKNDNGQLEKVYKNAVKYSALITVPITSVLILLSDPIVHIVFGDDYMYTPYYLRLVCIPFLLIGLGYQINGGLLNGQGKTRPQFISSVLVFIIGLPLSLYLIPLMGVTGLLITMNIATLTGVLYILFWISRNFDFLLDWKSSGKIYLSSAIAFAPINLILPTLYLQDWPQLFLGGTAYAVIYLIMILLFKTLTISDVTNLRRILSSTGPLQPFFNLFLTIIEKTQPRT
jgi:O-antigen/teichoic acid export membrane protein|tara:strand:+ start:715 stop:2229 length:1515 start_codon:yes stop_codon:yes gene_type:complete